MKIFIVILLVASVAALAMGNPAITRHIKSSPDSRLINGIPAKDGQFPYQAFIVNSAKNGNTFTCNGVLIGRSWVLTTAHCVRIAETIRVYLGSINIPDSTVIVTSKTFTRHVGYSSAGSINDIGIIALPVIISETENIKVINFAKRTDETFDGEIAIVSGFGNKTSSRGILNYGTARILSNDECKKFFGSDLRDSRLCTVGDLDPEQLPCNEYGSPLVVYRDGKPLLIGLVNLSIACMTSSRPIGYTRISSFTDWIAEKSGIV